MRDIAARLDKRYLCRIAGARDGMAAAQHHHLYADRGARRLFRDNRGIDRQSAPIACKNCDVAFFGDVEECLCG